MSDDELMPVFIDDTPVSQCDDDVLIILLPDDDMTWWWPRDDLMMMMMMYYVPLTGIPQPNDTVFKADDDQATPIWR